MQVRRVLVVAQDTELRDSLQDWLHVAGYICVGVSDLELAWEMLRLSANPMVVMVEQGDDRFSGETLVMGAGVLPVHGYVLLSTQSARAPRLFNPHTRHRVPVLAIPEDLSQLPDAIDETAQRLSRIPVHA